MSMPIQEMELELKVLGQQAPAPVISRSERIKRLFDLTAVIIGLVLISPLMAIIAIVIKLEGSGGPILFSQTRIGKNGRLFKMYKFRSMVVDAEERFAEVAAANEVSGAMFKMRNDPRVTRAGRLLRKTSLDELPQLFNVLKGEMSLVGPRPPLVREAALYRERDYMRLTVTPGCTGLWQVSGRSSVGFEEMVDLDLEYIRNRGFWYDLRILLRTIRVMFGSRNAY